MRAVTFTTVGLGLAALLAGGVPAAAEPSQAADAAALAAYRNQHLRWGACPPGHKELRAAGARCADVTVPLDYADPAGRTLRIAVSRIRATAPAGQRRGVLLSNPGGPGGPGLASTLALRPALKGTADAYDLIGFDPRFLGESTPLTCDPARKRPDPGPTTTPRREASRSHWPRAARTRAAATSTATTPGSCRTPRPATSPGTWT
ncbi:hypothetical protein RB200_14670 [Streptomyces sp. PmtG]